MSPVRTAPSQLSAAQRSLRSQYLEEVLGVLYPAASATARRRPERPNQVAEYLVIPHARRPRLLVPTRSRRIAAAAVRRYAEPRSRLAKLKREAVVAALRTGASAVLLRDRVCITGSADQTIDGYLRTVLHQDLALSVHIGPARANRKPVLQLLTPDGNTVGYAKLGIGPLTRRLVRAEAAALAALAQVGLRHLRVPRVLHLGQWNGHEVLVQSALQVWQPRAPLPPNRLADAMCEVASTTGLTRGPLVGSGYAQELDRRLVALGDRPEAVSLTAAARRLIDRAGQTTLDYGAWHGDWSPWNQANLADTLLVWDWERFTLGVPVGFDALHHELQRRIELTPNAADAVEQTVLQAGELLAPFAVAPTAREVTALLYLVDLAARYLTDRQAEAGARLGVLGTWLLPVLIRRAAAIGPAVANERLAP